MPIHDQSYRHYGGTRAPVGRSWTVIAWAGIREYLRTDVPKGSEVLGEVRQRADPGRERLVHHAGA